MNPIFWITGPPAAGKTTLCEALLKHFALGFHVEVDLLRQMVTQGLADSVPWTDETERQFQIAEAATCDIARRYHDEGFAVAVDHCRNPQRLDQVIQTHLTGLPVVKVLLIAAIEVNLQRNEQRTNKPFRADLLVDTINYTNGAYRNAVPEGWLVIDNSDLSVDETIRAIWSESS